jgi:branched-chain amino acid transport system substrate-binding protein
MSTFYLVGCEKKSKKVAFVGALTGRTGDIGTAARDGAILAIEEQNRQGGIDGQSIELLIGDDKNDPKEAVRVDESVIAQGVLGIVGHVTSVACVGGVEAANRAHVPLLSPTVSTNELTGKRDYFFRIYPASAQTASLLAQYVVEVRRFKRVAIVLDMGNRAHSESAALAFTARLRELGGDVVQTEPFVSSPTMRFSAIADAIIENRTDVLYVLANGMDTAMLAQQLMKQNKRVPMVASDWSMSNEVIQYGGRAVEGLTALHTLQFHSKAPRHRAFSDAYIRRFGREPMFAAAHAYDAMRLLLHATSGSVTPEQVARKLRSQQPFDTLQDRIAFDEFGDVTRKHWLVRVVNGHIQEVDK